jgi:D-glycero-D-manno-heptose 1,7-bisphosphate phosphatase
LKKAIFLDRDGVLNEAVVKNGKPYPPSTLAQVVIGNPVLPALRRFKDAGFLLIGVTNQPDVARGQTSRQQVEGINAFLMENLPVDEIRVCYHDDLDRCDCRKPLPGLILAAAADWGIHLADSYMIGDRWKDIEAGFAAGCQTVWLDAGYQEKSPQPPATFRVTNLAEAAQAVLKRVI